MKNRNYNYLADFGDGDVSDQQPIVDDLQVAAAAAAAAMRGPCSEENSGSDDISTSSDESSDADTDDSDATSSSDDDAILQERINLSLALDQTDQVRLTILPQYQLSSREGLATMIESSDEEDIEDESCMDDDDDDDDESDTEEIASYEELSAIINSMDDACFDITDKSDQYTAEELFGSLPPPSLDITLNDDDSITPAGSILNIIEGTIVIRADLGSKVLKEGSILVLENKSIIGVIEDLFGPVQAPLYALRYIKNTVDGETNGVPSDLVVGSAVYSIDRLSDYVLPDELRVKGYDEDLNEEGAVEDVQFSDDEAEAEYKRRLKAKRKKEREATDITANGDSATAAKRSSIQGRGGRRGKRGGGWPRSYAPSPNGLNGNHSEHHQYQQQHIYQQQQQQQQLPLPHYYGGQVHHPAVFYPGMNQLAPSQNGMQQMYSHATAGQLSAMSLQPHHVYNYGNAGAGQQMQRQPPPPPPPPPSST